CLFLLQSLEERGRETYIWIAEHHKGSLFKKFRDFFEHSGFSKGFNARLLSTENEISGREWDYIILDRYRTPPEEFGYWSGVGPVIGIDEGGVCRSRFDFLIDLLPSGAQPEPNLNAPGLLPLPQNRKPKGEKSSAETSLPLRVLICFGAEDSAGLGVASARSLARNRSIKNPEITLIAPADSNKQILGVRVLGMVPNLKERLAEYDLFITHFGLGAFEAVYARVPVLLVSPTAYHEKLSRNAGFASLGTRAAGRLEDINIGSAFIKNLGLRSEKIARRYGLDGDQKEDMGSYFGSIAPHSQRACPVCSSNRTHIIGRFPEETYRRCKHCGMIYLSRLRLPPIEYEKDYFFDFYKKQYGKTYIEDFPNLVEMGRKRLVHIRALCGAESGADLPGPAPRLLDIGCAYGPFLAAAAERGFSPSGVDPVEDAVEYINEKLGFPAWQGFFPTSKKAEDGPFDVVTLWYVIEHFEEPGKVLPEIHRILRKRGVLAFSTPSSSGISGRKDRKSFLKNSPPDHWTVWSPRICGRVLKRYGFSLRKIVVTGHHPERFPFFGRFVKATKKDFFWRLLFFVSRVFRLGDTFEVYAVKES
ncbi:MAG: methyltransferase domain-containing protein, partial [Treponema sp.]|nr:methyltransferase domain-containing protein [Treponema sp.]